MPQLTLLEWICLVPVAGGAVYYLLTVLTMWRFRRRPAAPEPERWPAVSILKPVYGLEKNLYKNLRTTCLQDYPEYEVVFSLQRFDDPALALLHRLRDEFGSERVRIVVDEKRPGSNGKINNLAGGVPHARYDIFVISDSDIRMDPGYLKAIVAPLLADPEAGYVCTPYKAAEAHRWFEKFELLSLNADFMPSVVFASETKLSGFCLGASIAFRRETLDRIGGIEDLADYLVEDYEMGRRIAELGTRQIFIPRFIDTMVDLKTPTQWWNHQVYWDQNTRAARPAAFFLTFLIRSVPFAAVFAALRGGDTLGFTVLAGALGVRWLTSAIVLAAMRDAEGLRALPWLPVRDVLGFLSWLLAFVRRTTHWRGTDFILTADGRLLPVTPRDEAPDPAKATRAGV